MIQEVLKELREGQKIKTQEKWFNKPYTILKTTGAYIDDDLVDLGLSAYVDKNFISPATVPGLGFTFKIRDRVFVYESRTERLFELVVKEKPDEIIVAVKKINL